MKKHLLFLCSANIDRSPAAESLFENNEEFEAKSAGLGPLTETQLTKSAVEWDDIIFVMDERKERHKSQLLELFPEAAKKEIIILDIPNEYLRYDPELERLLKVKLEEWLE